MPETRGGTPEQHAKAGHAGGVATASSHGSEFYREIGRKGGEARAQTHHDIAGHHEAAAHHHRQAAFHHSRGEDEEARGHAERGHAHGQHANERSRNELGQFTSSRNDTNSDTE